ncbi:MAG: lytic transglycosylase domain-containing protein [Gammaproteobacteria bacterium]|nr:lytic transglycosylase domain-containing protein [Gammaproteobacteria bacterium]MYF01445.1 lytic transglycosylase domain-containing protein [Gammaproteobacteria bacterium]MYI77122.1 lytic transglycosylase domain-containing protein [Gammaproteobacteria bacterium]
MYIYRLNKRELFKIPLLRYGAFSLALGVLFYFVGIGHATYMQEHELQATTAVVTPALVTDVNSPAPDATDFTSNQVQEDRIGWFAAKISREFPQAAQDATKFATWITAAADKHQVDDLLLASIIAAESSYRTTAVSDKGAIGPAQIIPRFWAVFCEPLNLHEPGDNIECSAHILSYLGELCDGDESCVIQSYNMGFPRVKAGKQFSCVARYEEKVERFKTLFSCGYYEACACQNQKCDDCFHIALQPQ